MPFNHYTLSQKTTDEVVSAPSDAAFVAMIAGDRAGDPAKDRDPVVKKIMESDIHSSNHQDHNQSVAGVGDGAGSSGAPTFLSDQQQQVIIDDHDPNHGLMVNHDDIEAAVVATAGDGRALMNSDSRHPPHRHHPSSLVGRFNEFGRVRTPTMMQINEEVETASIQTSSGRGGGGGGIIINDNTNTTTNTTSTTVVGPATTTSTSGGSNNTTKKIPDKTCHSDIRYQLGAAILVCFWTFAMVFSLQILPSLQHHRHQGEGEATSAPTSIRESLGIQDKIIDLIGTSAFLVEDDEDEYHGLQQHLHNNKNDTTTSPHHLALQWLLDEDPMQLPKSATNLFQRYALSLLYFSTSSVTKPWESCNPPSPANDFNETCDFMRILPTYPEDDLTFINSNFRWLSNSHECQWVGVFCDDWNDVVEIHLIGNGLSGSLPESLGLLLPHLEAISLSNNDLSGPIPTAWATDMKQLRKVRFEFNHLTGPISSEWMSMENAQHLNLGSNLLTGTVPTEIGLLGTSGDAKRDKSLMNLFLFSNPGLTGTMPTEIGNLERLAALRFSNTALHGTLPSEIGRLTDLKELCGQQTNIDGSIPSTIGQLSDLRYLRFQRTSISGSIPDELYDLTKLESLDLWQSNLGGTISPKIAKLASTLERLRVHSNNLRGRLPTQLGLLTNLDELFLHHNQLEGAIPVSFCGSGGASSHNDDVSIGIGADCLVPKNEDEPAVVCPDRCCEVCCDVTTEACMFMHT